MREAVGPLKALASKLKPRNDDDMIDRLHYIVSPSILFAFAFIIGAKQFVGQPIQCWAPSEFKRQWMQYAEGLCFVENTYFVSMDEKFPMHEEERQRRQIHYYQWVPFLLMGQALLLMLPKLIWNAFSWKSGLDVRSLIARAQALSARGEFEGKKKAGEELGARIGLSIEQRQRKQMSGIDGKLPDYPAAALDFGPCASANFLTGCYLLLKMLNLASVLFQLQVLTKFLGSADDDHQYWGVRVMQDLLAGRDWSQSGAFPRVTYCDVPIRKPSRAADYQNFSLQCVLMINMVNEKIFLFLWFWLMGLALVGMLNLLLWLFRAFNWDSSYQFVQSQLRLSNTTNVPRGKELHNFVRRGLSRDGVTVLRLIAANCDPLLASLLVKQLWHRFQEAKNQGQLKQAVESREKMAAAQPQESRHI